MARLVSPPSGLLLTSMEPLSGPRAVGAGGTQSIGGFVQMTSSPFGLWRWRFSMSSMRGQIARRYRGWITALHGGANATRWDFFDPDMMSPHDAGVDVSETREWFGIGGQLWSNGMPWSNGQGWESTPPTVAVAGEAERGDSVVVLGDEFWGRRLDVGDLMGFFPLHLGMYMITETLSGGNYSTGTYRVWPPLRKAITPSDFATLRPTLAMRLESEEAATAPRDASFIAGASVTMVEVLDHDVRGYFAD